MCLVCSQIIKPFTKSDICFSLVNSFSFELTINWVVAYFKVQFDIFIAELMQCHYCRFGTQKFAKATICTSTTQFGTDCVRENFELFSRKLDNFIVNLTFAASCMKLDNFNIFSASIFRIIRHWNVLFNFRHWLCLNLNLRLLLLGWRLKWFRLLRSYLLYRSYLLPNLGKATRYKISRLNVLKF